MIDRSRLDDLPGRERARFAAGIRSVLDARRLPWSVPQLGARVEYRFTAPAPRTGSASAASAGRRATQRHSGNCGWDSS